MPDPAIPLARWASRQLRDLGGETRSARLAALDGAVLLAERADASFRINGLVSSGRRSSRLYPTRDGLWFALTLLRAEDREMLPALFGEADIAIDDPEAIAAAVARHDCAQLVETGRLLGLPVASADEVPVSPPAEVIARGPRRERPAGHRPLVVDLSAIWAGPLAGHLLWLAGAEVVKVESPGRPDIFRGDDPVLFGKINQGKASVLADLGDAGQRGALVTLIRRADIVIESSRPRALLQLGIDAEALVREVPGLVWLSVTGHGASGDAAGWTGIGNDTGVAGGLARALADVTGTVGFVGDAVADPLTGILGALEGWRAYRSGEACRIGLSMSAIAALALREEREHDPALLRDELAAWGDATGQPFPQPPKRELLAPVHPLGSDTSAWLKD